MTKKIEFLNSRAKELKTFFEEKKITGFNILEAKKEGEPTIFEGYLDIKGQRLPIVIVTDNTIYTMIQIQVATAIVNDLNKPCLLELLNDYNLQFRMLKYSITKGGNILLTCSIPSSNNHFEPELFRVMIGQMEKHLEVVYKEIMNKVWGK